VAAASPAIRAAALLLALAGCADLRDWPLTLGPADGGGSGGAGGAPSDASRVPGIVFPGLAGAGSSGARLDARLPPDADRRDSAAPMSPPIDVTAQLGSWKYVDGALTVSCPGDPPAQDPLTGAIFQLQRGNDAPLLYATGPCTWRLDTSGSVGLFRAGDTCATVDSTAGTTSTFTVVSGRFAPSGQNAAVTIDLTLTSSENTETCDIEVAGTAMKFLGR
jgi:hypothetical protein